MKKIKTISFHDFMHGIDEDTFLQKAKKHIRKNESFYITIAGMTIFFIFTGDTEAMASNIDAKANSIYKKILSIGKWIIIIKAAVDMIQTASTGDFPAVKTKFIHYLLLFLALLSFPWAMEEIENLFNDVSATGAGK